MLMLVALTGYLVSYMMCHRPLIEKDPKLDAFQPHAIETKSVCHLSLVSPASEAQDPTDVAFKVSSPCGS
jgi:hypothetical protein